MDCPTCESMVDAYVDGELSARDSADFERALESCPGCRERLEAARKMSGLLRELPAERTPDLLRGRIERELRAIAGEVAPDKAGPASVGPQRNWTALAASLFLAAALGWLGGSLSGGVPVIPADAIGFSVSSSVPMSRQGKCVTKVGSFA